MTAIKKFREALGLTQRKLSQETGFTEGMISRWERGETPSDSALEEFKNYAVKAGRPDLVAILDPRPFTVKKVILPPKRGSGVDPHSLLDEIMQSDDAQAKLAVENFLFITTQYLRGAK